MTRVLNHHPTIRHHDPLCWIQPFSSPWAYLLLHDTWASSQLQKAHNTLWWATMVSAVHATCPVVLH